MQPPQPATSSGTTSIRTPKPSIVSQLSVCPWCGLVIPRYRYFEHIQECETGDGQECN